MINEKLSKIIIHAYNTVPYYKRLFDECGVDPYNIKNKEDLVKIPVLTKDQILAEEDAFLSEEHKYFPKRNELIVSRTSGSTGKMLKIYWDKKDYIRSMFDLWILREKMYGINPLSKFCSFHSTIYFNNNFIKPEDIMLLSSGRNLSFSKLALDNEHISLYYKKIMEFKPEWFFMQPSIALQFAKYISENGLELPETLKYIELTGEYLYASHRQEIEDVFKVPVKNMYGSMEVNGIALECPNGEMRCLENNVIIEVLKDGKPVKDGEKGEICITSLNNYAMPSIRYLLGDRVVVHRKPVNLEDGKYSTLDVLNGRVGEYVYCGENKLINSYVFVYAIESINKLLGYPIKQFKICQEDLMNLRALFVLKSGFQGWKGTVTEEFYKKVEEIGMEDFKWSLNFVDKILPDPTTGKLAFFENKLHLKQVASGISV